MPNNNMFVEILARLQTAEIVDDEEDFFFLGPEDVAASQEGQHRSYVGKLIADHELNV